MAIQLLPFLLKAATLVPALTNFLGAGTSTQKVAEKVATVATVLTGEVDPNIAVEKIAASSELVHKFQLECNKQYIEWDAVFLTDVQSARERDIKMHQTGYRNWRAHAMFLLAVAVIVVLTLLIWQSDNLSEYTKGVFTLVLGRFLGYLDNIYNFEFGTTRQSRSKDDTIERLSKKEGT